MVMMEGSKEKVGEFGPWNVVESTWEGMTMTMWLLKDGWEDEWRFVDDVPDDGQEPVLLGHAGYAAEKGWFIPFVGGPPAAWTRRLWLVVMALRSLLLYSWASWAIGQSWNSSSFIASNWSVFASSMFRCFLVMTVSMTFSTTSLSIWFASRNGVKHPVKLCPACWLQVKYRWPVVSSCLSAIPALHWLQVMMPFRTAFGVVSVGILSFPGEILGHEGTPAPPVSGFLSSSFPYWPGDYLGEG